MREREGITPRLEIPPLGETQTFTIQRDKSIYFEGNVASHILIVRSGRILIFNTQETGKRVSDLILAPSLIGSEVLHNTETYQSSAATYDASSVQRVDKAKLDELSQSQPGLIMALLAAESMHTLRLRKRIYSQRVGAQASVARVLLDMAEGEQYEIFRVPHQIIGDIAGAARETTSVIMKDFEDRGLIEGSGSTRKALLRPDLLELVSKIGIPKPASIPSHVASQL